MCDLLGSILDSLESGIDYRFWESLGKTGIRREGRAFPRLVPEPVGIRYAAFSRAVARESALRRVVTPD